jgi:hypothetical protein
MAQDSADKASFFEKHFGKKSPNCGKKGYLVQTKTETLSMGDFRSVSEVSSRAPLITSARIATQLSQLITGK